MKARIIFVFILLSSVLLLFQNCSGFEGVSQQSEINSALGCDSILLESYKSNIYPYFKANRCAQCHTNNTTYAFTSDNITFAFQSFNQLGLSRIDQILEAGHQGNDYNSIKPKLDEFELTWDKSLSDKIKCEQANGGEDDDEDIGGGEFITDSVNLDFFSTTQSKYCRLDFHLEKDVTEPVTLEWDLSATYPGVSVKVDLLVETNEFPCGEPEVCGEKFYCVSEFYTFNPRVTTGDEKIYIKNLNILANDNDFSLTTFSHINTELEPNLEDVELINGGSAGLIEANGDVLFSNETVWQLKFEILKKIDTL